MSSHLASTLTLIFLLLCALDDVIGIGPDELARPPIWNLTMSQCALFRNETVLRPRFLLCPESIKGIPLRYCCEYQPLANTMTTSPASFNLSNYSYGPNEGTLLAVVGSSLMEGIGHSAIREWRSQLMYNGGVVCTYVTLFSILSGLIRRSIRRRSTRRNRKHAKEIWRWQKVFEQFAVTFVVAAYLCLVEDVSGRRLDGLACPVLGTVIGATIYSAAVELYVIMQIFHFNPIVKRTKGDSDSDSNSPVWIY